MEPTADNRSLVVTLEPGPVTFEESGTCDPSTAHDAPYGVRLPP